MEIINNKVILPNYIKYPYDHRFRDYSIDYELVIPQNTVVISLNKDRISLEGDGEDDEDTNIQIENNKVTINGSTIEYDSENKDSIIINGKKYLQSDADKVMDSLKQRLEKTDKVDISIKNGDKEVSVKTK